MVHVSLGVVFLSGKSGAITEVCAHFSNGPHITEVCGPNVSQSLSIPLNLRQKRTCC